MRPNQQRKVTFAGTMVNRTRPPLANWNHISVLRWKSKNKRGVNGSKNVRGGGGEF